MFLGILEILILDVCLLLIIIFMVFKVTMLLYRKYYVWRYMKIDKKLVERDKKYGGDQ